MKASQDYIDGSEDTLPSSAAPFNILNNTHIGVVSLRCIIKCRESDISVNGLTIPIQGLNMAFVNNIM